MQTQYKLLFCFCEISKIMKVFLRCFLWYYLVGVIYGKKNIYLHNIFKKYV